ncbi:MAG: PaaI family thioesterase [Paracoccaceae bacterium]|nr:PaaI family thioesterase [Paracoccaceae bacterium]
MTLRDRIQKSFDRQALMATLGASLTGVTPGAVTISCPVLPNATQQQGMAHGGLIFAIGDSAAGYSALSLLPEDQEVVTSELKINYIAAAKGGNLVARGKVYKPGKRLMVVGAEVFSRQGGAETLIAVLQGTMVPVPA